MTIGSLSAFAAPPVLRLPAAMLYMKLDLNGMTMPPAHDRLLWQQMSMNLGGIITRIEPMPKNRLMGHMDDIDGAGAAILNARTLAKQAGYDFIIVYGVLPEASEEEITEAGKPRRIKDRSIIAGVRRRLTFWEHHNDIANYEPPTNDQIHKQLSRTSSLVGEAHLLDVRGGPPLASAWAEAEKLSLVQKYTSKDKRELMIIEELVLGIQREIYQLSYQNLGKQKSLAD